MAIKKKAAPVRNMPAQRQLYVVVGNLDEPVNGFSSWAFNEHANSGDDAVRQAKANAARYGYQFEMEVCQYVRAPRIKGGTNSYTRIRS